MSDGKRLVGVGAVLRKGEMVLVQDHVKSGCWTIPVGKAESGETYLEAITRELKEELNLNVQSGRLRLEKEQYCEGVGATVLHVVYDIEVSNLEELTNLEPEKHREVRWMSIGELKLKKLTDTSKLWLGALKGGLRPSFFFTPPLLFYGSILPIRDY